jgi:hypothetical protein
MTGFELSKKGRGLERMAETIFLKLGPNVGLCTNWELKGRLESCSSQLQHG